MNFVIKKEQSLIIRGELGKIVLAGGIFCSIFTAVTLFLYFRDNSTLIPSFFFLTCSLIGISSGEGIQVDHKRKRIRSYSSILWMSWGEWFPLENFKCISVSLTGGVTKRGREMSIYKIFLLPIDPYKQMGLQLGESAYQSAVIKHAENLGQKLKLPVIIKE